jgi:hypothetical protein
MTATESEVALVGGRRFAASAKARDTGEGAGVPQISQRKTKVQKPKAQS